MDLNVIAKILQAGLAGLAFLLAYLAHNIIAREQKKPKPDSKILSSSSKFMWFSLCLGVLTGVAQLGEIGLKTWLPVHQELDPLRSGVAPPNCKDALTARWKIDWKYTNCKAADLKICGDPLQHAYYEMNLTQAGCIVSGEAFLEAQANSEPRKDIVFGSVNGTQFTLSIRVGGPSKTQTSLCEGSAGDKTLIAQCVDLRPDGPVSWKMTASKI